MKVTDNQLNTHNAKKCVCANVCERECIYIYIHVYIYIPEDSVWELEVVLSTKNRVSGNQFGPIMVVLLLQQPEH